MDYKSVIESRYNREAWESLLHDIFLSGANFRTTPIPVDAHSPLVSESLQLGTITLKDDNKIAVYEIKLSNSVDIVENRVGIRNLLFSDWKFKGCAGAFIFCYRDNESVLRFSYVSQTFTFGEDGKMAKEETDTKRFTYILGEGHRSRTAIGQFENLKSSSQTLKDLTKAFSLDAVSDRFFDDYKEVYEDIVEYVTGKRYVKVANKWEEKVIHAPNEIVMAEFSWYEDPEKTVRDYVKRLMSRIVFLQFIQKKGWLGVPVEKKWGEGDKEFLQHLYEKYDNKDNFIDGILELLFDDINHKRENDIANFILGRDIKVPYLNGGLFERDSVDERTFRLPRTLMDKMMNFFSSYNFTIDENDPDDAEIGVDPEMLGRIFENLLEDNKDKGAFYTPKEIVQYMCQESLIAYLQKGKSDAEAEAIRIFVTTYDASVLSESLKRDIDTKLKNVKICDPAIGSGAFPMGLLKELFACRSAIEGLSDDNAAEIKKHIIQNNIYGVDIEKGAVEIARLRFWLAIVVDEKTPQALPNMDFKIMQGNSLIPTFMGKYVNLNDKKRHINYQSISRNKAILHDLQTEFYGSEANHKAELLIRIKYLILEIVKLQMDYEHRLEIQNAAQTIDLFNPVVKEKRIDEEKAQVINMCAEIQRQLNDSNIPASERASIALPFFDWKILFSEVFSSGTEEDGFDIVIGNPPYIDSETMTRAMPDERNLYVSRFKTAKGNWDIYIVFYELGIDILKEKGVLSFITPNKWLSIGYGQKLREFCFQYLNAICDCQRIKVFEAGNEPVICTFTKSEYPAIKISRFESNKSLTIVQFVDKKIIDVSNLGICISEHLNLLLKIKNCPHVVSDFVDSENPFSTAEAYELVPLVHEYDGIENSYRLINTGTIDPYVNLWGITQTAYLKGKYMRPVVNSEEFARKFPKRVRQVKAHKIILSGMRFFEGYFDKFGEYIAGKSTIVLLNATKEDYFTLLLGLLNSRLMAFYIKQSFSALGIGGGINFSNDMVADLPIPDLDCCMEIAPLVNSILESKQASVDSDTTRIEKEIDRVIYGFYGLTQKEIETIESSPVAQKINTVI